MSKIAIVTDSCASIPEDLIEDLNIHWVPYYIHRGMEVLRDLVTISREDFYKWLPTTNTLPHTASPGPGDYLNLYTKLIQSEAYDSIISIHMTSKGSGAYQAARAAKIQFMEMMPDIKVEVIDTLNVSMCHGWMVIEAARAALDGFEFQEIIQKVNSIIPKAQMLQTADTLRYLYIGGRIGRAKHLVGSVLNIKPIISMKDGVIVALGQARSIKKAYEQIIGHIQNNVGDRGKIKVAYVHAAAANEVSKLKEMVEEKFTIVESLITELSPALGVHTGPGTTGLCYYPVTD